MNTGEQALSLICPEVPWVLEKCVLPHPHYLRQWDCWPLLSLATAFWRPGLAPGLGSTVEQTLVVGVLVRWLRGHESRGAGPVPGWLWQLGELAQEVCLWES